jgi:hypothetical protein
MRVELRANSYFITGYMRSMRWTPEAELMRVDLTGPDQVYEDGPHRVGPGL